MKPDTLKPRKNVAILVESSRTYGRGILRGVAQFARNRGSWSILHEEMTIDATPSQWVSEARIDGMIARVDEHNAASLRRLHVPIIDVRCRQHLAGIPQVETDDNAVTRLAFNHLRERGFRRFAFCGYRNAHYSENRLKQFRWLVEERQYPLSVYETVATSKSAPLSDIERQGVIDGERLEEWLSSLEPPTGLFVCNDIRGQQVLRACKRLGKRIPDDLGVIGVDDDDTICPLCDPPLSSVEPDAEKVGYVAASLLDSMMQGQVVVDSICFIPPKGVTQRLSTQVEAVEDRDVAEVCHFIREHACNGIDVSDLIALTSLSRRQLERRFRAALGRTPHEELTAARIARIKQLLIETDLPLEQLAPIAGYSHKESLAAVFKRETGTTPGEYRRKNH